MSANVIRRSDKDTEERYKKIAKNLENLQEDSKKFNLCDYSKGISYHEQDSENLPMFTNGNYINLSNIDNKFASKPDNFCEDLVSDIVNNSKESFLKERSNRRRQIISQIIDEDDEEIEDEYYDDWDDDEEEEDINLDDLNDEDICPKCKSSGKNISPDPENPDKVLLCLKCEHKWVPDRNKEDEYFGEFNEFDSFEDKRYRFPFGKEDDSDYNDIINRLSSIETMLPAIIANKKKSMNKISSNIVKGLIDTLNIDSNDKKWLEAQIDNGILNKEVFMRNIRASLRNRGEN